jgi:hypothetical protein
MFSVFVEYLPVAWKRKGGIKNMIPPTKEALAFTEVDGTALIELQKKFLFSGNFTEVTFVAKSIE